MIRWIFLGAALGAVASVWGVGSDYLLITAFLVMFANFATFCLLYERPMDRARYRVATRLRGMSPNTDAAQRLETAPIRATASDRQLGFGPMVLANIATGLAGVALLVSGIVMRML